MIELYSQQIWELFFDEPHQCPVEWSEDDLFVAYSSPAELGCFLALGWPLPANIFDLYYQHLREMNGAAKTGRIADAVLFASSVSLVSALRLIGREDLIVDHKQEERNYVIENGVVPLADVKMEVHKRRIFSYCKTDVIALAALLEPFARNLTNFDQALVNGEFGIFVSRCIHNGMPIDAPLWTRIDKHRHALLKHLITQMEAEQASLGNPHRFFTDQGVFSQAAFERYIEAKGWGDFWPLTPSGKNYSRRDEDLEEMSDIYAELKPLRSLLKTITQLRQSDKPLKAGFRDKPRFTIGSDGRSRPRLGEFGQAAGRCNPRGDCLLGKPHWMRRLLKPEPGMSLVCVDAAQEEFGLAGALSGDRRMVETYARGGDQYIEVAINSGVAPPGATKDTHPEIRKMYKSAMLAIQYGGGDITVSNRLKLGSPFKGSLIIADHQATYPQYWVWAEEKIKKAFADGYIESVLGWRLWVGEPWRQTKRTSILNFPVQAAGADVLHVAAILAVRRGLGPYVSYSHHDALYCYCPADTAERVGEMLVECFRDAGKVVCGDWFDLRCDKPHIVNYPNRYEDKEGAPMWAQVMNFLDSLPPGDATHELAP
jgi:hypothetical protein